MKNPSTLTGHDAAAFIVEVAAWSLEFGEYSARVVRAQITNITGGLATRIGSQARSSMAA